MQELITTLEAIMLTPDGGITDPNHPGYALLWLLEALAH